ncbi:MAG: hypothetical protein LBC64_06080 [Fibromonadaceae bacterium]|jgi:uncharacterized protein (TIGR02145 family)|nr:hypothetical protein [Fibromonadaceae bacterium]
MKTQLGKLALLTVFGLAMAFTFSCSNDGGGGSGNGGGWGSSSSSRLGNSSSSMCNSSLGQTGVVYGTPVNYGDETYQTVVIGNQTWMARNLNYDVPDNDTDLCYDNNPDNCTTYGRLYNWATAMELFSICTSSSCASLVNAKHRGICPSGWHIPSNADWEELLRYVDLENCGEGFINGSYYSFTAGKYLKSENGWDYRGTSGNGEDKYGFAALPGGLGTTIVFLMVGEDGNWWSASEETDNKASVWQTSSRNGSFNDGDLGDKYLLYSVRCLKD